MAVFVFILLGRSRDRLKTTTAGPRSRCRVKRYTDLSPTRPRTLRDNLEMDLYLCTEGLRRRGPRVELLAIFDERPLSRLMRALSRIRRRPYVKV